MLGDLGGARRHEDGSIDGIGANAALLQRAGACVVIHSDDTTLIQRLNQEAAIALGAAARAGIPITRAQAIAWITANPARALGIAEQTGTIERGKMADVVLWSGDPFSSLHARRASVYRRRARLRPARPAPPATLRFRARPTRGRGVSSMSSDLA